MIERHLILDLPVDRLALAVLADYKDTSEWNAYNYVNNARNAGFGSAEFNALNEAVSWLKAHGLLATDLLQRNEAAFVTRLGQHVLSEGPQYLYAVERLQDGLHPLIEAKARPQFLLSEYEQAVFVSHKAVEIRTRKLARLGDEVHGVDVFNHAFGKGGPLRDTSADPGEQEGMRAFIAGAYAILRNPAGHREVDYGDPIEAAEAVQTASLLMRILDRVEARQE